MERLIYGCPLVKITGELDRANYAKITVSTGDAGKIAKVETLKNGDIEIYYEQYDDSKDAIIKSFILEELDEYDKEHVMTLSRFMKCVEDGGFTEYDGFGQLVYKGEQVTNSTTICDEQEFKIGNRFYSMKKIKSMFGKDINVAWFNR